MKPSDPPAQIADTIPAVGDAIAPESAGPRRRHKWRAPVAVTLGLLVGLGTTETVFRGRDRGAFPLVNVYERDEARGVRLEPGSVTRVGRPGAQVTEVRVNRDGYRGADWPAPSPDEVLVVGDSQSFGLGVSEGQTLAARLHAALGRPVLDASVPTYGPPEYAATLRELLPTRSPRAVVVAINLLNDFGELEHANVERHTAIDGWAVRAELPAARGGSSPLREALIRRSHTAFAVWKWWRTRESMVADVPPEPGWEDLVAAVESARAAARSGDARRSEADRTALAAAEAEVPRSRERLVGLVRRYAPLVRYAGAARREWDEYIRSEGVPEERIFEIDYGGCGPPPSIYGYGRRYSSSGRFPSERIRTDVESLLREFASAQTFTPEAKAEIRDALAARDAAVLRLGELRRAAPPPPTVPRPALAIATTLRDIRSLVPGRLVVLAVPVDVQVSAPARALRGASEADASALDEMTASLVAEARAAGAEAVDPTAALTRVSEGAFLPDGHLAPAGHQAVADALAEVLRGPPG